MGLFTAFFSQASFVETEQETKKRFITMSPSGSCFLVASCLTSLKRAELSTQAKQVFKAGDFVSINFLK